MSWESTLDYYRIINEEMRKKLGSLHSAKILLYSFDFQQIEILQHNNNWDQLTSDLIQKAKCLEAGGADFLLICTNTMHIMADAIRDSLQIPLLNIVDVTAEAIKSEKITKACLLGTRFTMEKDFYKGRLSDIHTLEVSIPGKEDRDIVHDIIYNELCKGVISGQSKTAIMQIIQKMIAQGCEGIVLGCTELPMIIKQDDIAVPVFDTTTIHAHAAVKKALS